MEIVSSVCAHRLIRKKEKSQEILHLIYLQKCAILIDDMNVIIHGTLAFDRIMNFPGTFRDNILPDKIHALNVSFTVDKMKVMRGGTGGNIAYNLSLLGESPTVVTAVGHDFGDYMEFLKERGIKTDSVKVYEDEFTPSASIITDQNNNQITAFFVGAVARGAEFDFSTCDPKETLVILSPSNNKEETLHFVDECKKYKLKYIFDPGQTISGYNGAELKECISGSYIFCANDYELALTIKKTGLTDDDILDRTRTLIVTLGKKGSYIRSDHHTIDVDAFVQDKMKDPTGAGDAYRAGLIKSIIAGLDMKEMGRVAACSASYAIEHIGTQEHSFTMDEFRERYKNHYKQDCPL